jgi:stalled ribosome alternative rescue factor ArfA
MRQVRKRNPIARALRSPLFRKRVVESKKVYNRKKLKGNIDQ